MKYCHMIWCGIMCTYEDKGGNGNSECNIKMSKMYKKVISLKKTDARKDQRCENRKSSEILYEGATRQDKTRQYKTHLHGLVLE